jgi:hypothetical protein
VFYEIELAAPRGTCRARRRNPGQQAETTVGERDEPCELRRDDDRKEGEIMDTTSRRHASLNLALLACILGSMVVWAIIAYAIWQIAT